MDYKKAFAYVFEDPDWISKFIIGALLGIVGFLIIPFFFIMGYVIEIIQNVMQDKTPTLPVWDSWGEKFQKGLTLFLIGLTYSIPSLLAILVGVVGIVLMVLGGDSGSDVLAVVGLVIVIAGFVIAGLYMIFLGLIYPAITIKYALTESFSETLKAGELFQFIKNNLGQYLLVILVIIGFNMLLQTVGQICCLISLAGIFYTQLLSAHLYGQLYLESQKS